MKRGIAFSGGGMTAIAHLGVLEYFREHDILQNFKYFSGASAGSIIATMCAAQVPVQQMIDIMMNTDFSKMNDRRYGGLYNLYSLFEYFGWASGNHLDRWIDSIIQTVFSNSEITFEDLYKMTGNTLIIPETDLSNRKTIYYCRRNTPLTSIASAIKKTVCVPGYFRPIREGQTLYVDGGLLDNYPIRALYEYISPDEVIGINLVSNDKLQPTNLENFVIILIQMLREQGFRAMVSEDDLSRTIQVNIDHISALDFNLTPFQKKNLIQIGYQAIERNKNWLI